MILVACVEDRFGMLFHDRRVSSDHVVSERIKDLAADTRLWVDPYTAKLFDGKGVCISNAPAQDAQIGEVFFAERSDFSKLAEKIERIVLYKWNRKYPYDRQFPLELLQEFHLLAREDFPGNSHETVTQEVYVR